MTLILSILAILGRNSIWMAWNIFLGVIPLVLGYKLFCKKHTYSLTWFAGFILYILFLPNAAYIFTDIIHLPQFAIIQSRTITSAVALQFVLFLAIGYYLFVQSYQYFEQFVTKRITVNTTALRLVSFTTISIGVYMGRVLRFNSWDVFTSPIYVATQTLTHLHTTPALFFIVLFTALMLAIVTVRDQINAEISSRR